MDNDPDPDEKSRRAAELIDYGSETLGAFTGAALGSVAGPPGWAAGAVGGVLATRVVKRIGAEVQERVLGPRQRARAGLALGVAVDRIREQETAGEVLRDDGFFEPRERGERPEADELLEGVLLHAMNAYQEKKVPYMGKFFASVASRSDISPEYAHLLLRIINNMSYRQLVALAYLAENQGSQEFLDLGVRRSEEGSWKLPDGFDRELNELGEEMRLVGIRQQDGDVIPAAGTWGGGDLSKHDLSTVTLSKPGQDLYDLCGLSDIPRDEKSEILSLLRGDQPS
jgi:hypothetical protein